VKNSTSNRSAGILLMASGAAFLTAGILGYWAVGAG